MRFPFHRSRTPGRPSSAGGAARPFGDWYNRDDFPELTVTVAGEAAYVVNVYDLLTGRGMTLDHPLLRGARPESYMRALVVFPDTKPTIGLWIGDPGAFGPAQEMS